MFKVAASSGFGIVPDAPGHMFKDVALFEHTDSEFPMHHVETARFERIKITIVKSSGHNIELNEENFATYLLPLRGTISVETNKASYFAKKGEGLFFPPNTRKTSVRSPASGNFEAAVIMAPFSTIMPSLYLQEIVQKSSGMLFRSNTQDRADRALRGYLCYLIDELRQPNTPLVRIAAQRSIEVMVIEMFADIFDEVSHCNRPHKARDLVNVQNAEEFMQLHYSKALTVSDIANATNVGVRSLQTAFKRHREISPRSALNAVRLERAHDMLLRPEAVRSVTEIAMDCGFSHIGRFAAAYRERYGTLPSQTLYRSL